MYVENFTSKRTKSGYIPPAEVIALTADVKRDYETGHELLNRPWTELNDRSIIEDENRGQMMFNQFVDTSIEDPNEAWQWRGTRSMARNKGIAMHANLTANILLPAFTAQNEDSEEDQEYSEVMTDTVAWMCDPSNSGYHASFLQIVFAMMYSPISYLGAEWCEVMMTIRDRTENGEYVDKEMIDEVLSGFQANVYGATEILRMNMFERNLQKQRAIIERKYVEIDELAAEFGEHPNFGYLKPGVKYVFDEKDGLFYEYFDEEHPTLVEKVVWKNRRKDMEVPFIGGIYMGATNVRDNPIKHRDNKGAPKYNKVPFGYMPIGNHFACYKSMMNVVGWDHQLYDAMSEIIMNRSILEVDQPLGVYGAGEKDKIDSEIIFPKAVVAFEDPQAKIMPILPKADLAAGYNALAATEKSINDASVDPVSSGAMPGGHQQAYVVATVQANAKKILSESAKLLVISMAQYGSLLKDIVINHVTVPQVEELVGGALKLKYRTLMLPNKEKNGRAVSKKIVFDDTLIGLDMTDEEKSRHSLKLLEETGYPHNKHTVIRVNPERYAAHSFFAKSDIEEIFVKNNEYWQPILTNLYTMLRQDPLADQEWLLRKLARAYFNTEGENLVRKQPLEIPGAQPAMDPAMQSQGGKTLHPGTPGGAYANVLPKPGNNELGRMAQSKALSTTLPMGGH